MHFSEEPAHIRDAAFLATTLSFSEKDGLSHPIRRHILRALNSSLVGDSPVELAVRFDLRVARVNYHALQLVDAGLAVLGRSPLAYGATWLISTCASDRRLSLLLETLEEWDERYLASECA